MITKEIVHKHLLFFKSKIEKKILTHDYKSAIQFLKLFARMAYRYNLFYTDEEAEQFVSIISNALIGKKQIKQKTNKIVFYDSFAIDNRGLTHQYLRAIFSWDSELLFITHADIQPDVLNELKEYPKTQILFYDESNINTFRDVVDRIVDFAPEKVLLHFSPWDIAGFCIFNSLENVDRFLINLTDHAFWLGKSSCDYVLEFRAYGSYLSVAERKIPIQKLLLQPYYPIISKSPFAGFPFDKGNLVIAFAGSNFYKIAGRDNTFLKLIKEVLNQNPNVIFVLAGNGNRLPIEKFIEQNKFENRFYLLGNRRDISSMIVSIDIYVNTFPLIGGLMSQYAAYYHKPIIGYTDSDLYSFNDVEDLLQIPREKLLVKDTKETFVDYFNKLIEYQEVRSENVRRTYCAIPSPEHFNTQLKQNMFEYKYAIYESFTKTVSFDKQSIIDLYLDIENTYNNNHYWTIFMHLKFKSILYFPWETLKVLMKRCIYG